MVLLRKVFFVIETWSRLIAAIIAETLFPHGSATRSVVSQPAAAYDDRNLWLYLKDSSEAEKVCLPACYPSHSRLFSAFTTFVLIKAMKKENNCAWKAVGMFISYGNCAFVWLLWSLTCKLRVPLSIVKRKFISCEMCKTSVGIWQSLIAYVKTTRDAPELWRICSALRFWSARLSLITKWDSFRGDVLRETFPSFTSCFT